MTQNELLSFLKKLPLFGSVSDALLQSTLQSEHAQLLPLASGEMPPPHCNEMLGVVLSGKLLILSTDEARSVVLRSVEKGEIFGAASLFTEAHAPLSRLKAKGAVQLLFLDRDAVHGLLRADANFMDAYLRLLADRIEFLNGKIRAFTAGSAERRLALWLLEHAQGDFVRNTNLAVLADVLDIGRASLYRALDKLENEGLILRNGRDICILSPDELMQKYHS